MMRDLVALTKPRISVLNVAMTGAGLALAGRPVPTGVVAATLVGTLLLVGSANTLNMYLERDIDGRMARTRRRPLPAGRLRPGVALWFGVAQTLVAVPLLTFGANALCGLLGTLALLGYVLVYTPLKQHTVHALLVGAVPGAMPVGQRHPAAYRRPRWHCSRCCSCGRSLISWPLPCSRARTIGLRG